jgi:hypothetical protein
MGTTQQNKKKQNLSKHEQTATDGHDKGTNNTTQGNLMIGQMGYGVALYSRKKNAFE